MNVYLCVLMTCMLGMSSAAWQNDYDGSLHFTCPSGQAVSRVISTHNNYYEDRRFDIECATLNVVTAGMQESCTWTSNYVNEFDQPVDFECAYSGFLAGMESYHNNYYEDRRWKFYCCRYPMIQVFNCTNSGWTNTYDGYQNYAVPPGKVITRVYSIHNNYYEDRRYQYTVCNMMI